MSSMTRVRGRLGLARLPGSAGLAGGVVLRLAGRGLLRPGGAGLVTEPMTASEARTSWPMWSDTPWAELSSGCGERVRCVLPGDCLVVGGAGLEAAVEDADEPVAELAERSVVAGAAGALAVVIGARS